MLFKTVFLQTTGFETGVHFRRFSVIKRTGQHNLELFLLPSKCFFMGKWYVIKVHQVKYRSQESQKTFYHWFYKTTSSSFILILYCCVIWTQDFGLNCTLTISLGQMNSSYLLHNFGFFPPYPQHQVDTTTFLRQKGPDESFIIY